MNLDACSLKECSKIRCGNFAWGFRAKKSIRMPRYNHVPPGELSLIKHMKVAILKAGLANQDYRKKQEMRFIFRYGTAVALSGLSQEFNFT